MNNQLTNIRYGLYARKSSASEDKQMQSIDSQLDEMKEFAIKHDLNIKKIYIDEASAHIPNNRPKFTKLMEDIKNGYIDGILCWKTDRLARNPIEEGQIKYELQSGVIKVIQTPTNRYLPTDNTIPLTFELGMANQYSLDLSVIVKRGNRKKIKEGGWPGAAPTGYINDKDEKTVIPDPERFERVKDLFMLYKTGSYSLSEVVDIATHDWKFLTRKTRNQGGLPLCKSSLHKILTNTFYYGFMKYGENSNWGNHKPMITQAEFEEVQKVLARQCQKGKSGHSNYDFCFTGCIKCGECGSQISAEEKVKYACPGCRLQLNLKSEHNCRRCGYEITKDIIAKGNYYEYYRCTKKVPKADGTKCGQKSVKSKDISDQFSVYAKNYQINPAFQKWALKWIKFSNKQEFKKKDKQNKVFQRDYDSLEKKLHNLTDMRLTGELSPEEYAEHKDRLQKERNEAKNRLNKAEHYQSNWIQKAEGTFDFMQGLTDRFQDGTTKERKYIFRRLGQNFVLKDGKLSLEVKKPYLLVKELEKASDLSSEPKESQSGGGNSPPSDQSSRVWLATRESDLRPC